MTAGPANNVQLRHALRSPRQPGEHAPGPEASDYPAAVAEIVAEDRPDPQDQGLVLFFTGLSGSGKSTLARALMDRLLERGGRDVTSLDGDVVRRHLSAGLTFSRADRETNIRRIGWVAAEIARHGGVDTHGVTVGWAEFGEHPVGRGLASRWATDAHPHPQEIAGAQMGTHRFQTVVTVVASAELHPQLAGIKIQLVVNGNHVGGWNLVEGRHCAHRNARLVHVGGRFCQHHPHGIHAGDRRQGGGGHLGPLLLVQREGGAVTLCEVADSPEPHVVAGERIGRARIPEPDHEVGT